MSLRTSLGIAAVVFTALTACSGPPIRCETDDNCLEDMKCDVRQGLCVDEGEYIEDDGGTTGASIDCHAASSCQPRGEAR